MSAIKDGWLEGATRIPGPANKVYAEPNKGDGIVWHSMEGWLTGSLAELAKPERDASWLFSIDLAGRIYQHYPVTASCWASGNKEANTRYWSVEMESLAANPLNQAQLDASLTIIEAWEGYSGKMAVRGGNLATMFEHREVATKWSPNAGPTACPSERYTGLWKLLVDDVPPPTPTQPPPPSNVVDFPMVKRILGPDSLIKGWDDVDNELLPSYSKLYNAMFKVWQALDEVYGAK